MDCFDDERHVSFSFDVAVFLFLFMLSLLSFFGLLHSSLTCVPSKDIHERRAAMIEIEQACPVFTLCFSTFSFFLQFSSSDLFWVQTGPLLHS